MHCLNCGSPLGEADAFCGICGSPVEQGLSGVPASPEVFQASNQAQEGSFVAATMAYRAMSCPACGQSGLRPRPDGQFADCEFCGCTVDIRTRDVLVERHEHVVNNITYESLGDEFVLSGGGTVLASLAGGASLAASQLVVPGSQGIRVVDQGACFGLAPLKSLVLEEGVRHIGASAFSGCANLEEVSLPSTLETIDSAAFENCASLKRIVIPDGVHLGSDAFRGCSGLTDVAIGDGVRGGEGCFIACESLRHVTLGFGTNVADSMFANCPSLEGVQLSPGIASIGQYAFCDCAALSACDFPDSLRTIGGAAFRGCVSLSRVRFPQGLESVGADAFDGCEGLTEAVCAGPTRLGDGVFADCVRLRRVSLGEGMTVIPAAAFEGCSLLSEIDLPSTLTELRVGSFKGCSSLLSCPLPFGVTYVPREAFSGCSSLLTVGNGALHVGERAFRGCSSLRAVAVDEAVPEGAFLGCSSLETLVLGPAVSGIGRDAFHGAIDLRAVEFPAALEYIGPSAFEGCSLEAVQLPLRLSVVADNAFRACEELRSVVVSPSVTQIQAGAFANCLSLELVAFFGKAPSIAPRAFLNDDRLTTVQAPMAFFANMNAAPLFAEAPSLATLLMPDFSAGGVAGLAPGLLGSRMVTVNGNSVQWDAWIEGR